MRYGRTILEVLVVQALLLAAIMIVPFSVIASLSPEACALIATGVSAVLGGLLYVRHVGRMQRSGRQAFKAQVQSNPA